MDSTTTTVAPTKARRKRRQGIGLYKSGNRWYLDAWIRGQRIRQAFGAIDERLARELATAARAAVLRGQAGIALTVRKDLTFDRAVREFKERHVASKRATTQRSYGQDLARLEAFFAGKRLSEIGPLTVEGDRKARTKGHTVALTSAEEARLMAALREPYTTLVRLALHTGVRLRSEGLTLTWEDVDLERQRLTVQAVHAKNGSARVIPLSGPLVAALTALRPVDGAPTTRVFVSRAGRPLRNPASILTRAARRAKVPGVSPHVFRHTWASRFMQAGGDLRTLQALGGWRRIEMVTRYAHSDEVHAAAALARMVAAFPVPTTGALPALVPVAGTRRVGSVR